MVQFARCSRILGGSLLLALAVGACAISEGIEGAAFQGQAGASGVDAAGANAAGANTAGAHAAAGTSSAAGNAIEPPLDECPDDPLKVQAGVCGCGVLDDDSPGAAGCVAVKHALAHRYAFDGTGNVVADLVSGADGTLLNSVLSGDTGTLVLSGTNGEYVNLPNGIISSLTDATIEVWLNWAGLGQWERIFDFGTSDSEDVPGNGSSYFFLTPGSAASVPTLRVAFSTQGNGQETVLDARQLPSGVVTHVAVVVDDTADQLSIYVNGVLEAAGRFDGHLADIVDVNNWIGRSQFTSDPLLAATLGEFRIYHAALNARQVALTYAGGPDPAFLPTGPASAM